MPRSFNNLATVFLSGNCETRPALSEVAFHKMISLERRRTERSQKCFLLMLLDMDPTVSAKSQRTLAKVLAAVSESTRETDITGWYRGNSVVGVMFTEIGAQDDQSRERATLMTRVSDTFHNRLSPSQFGQLRISFYHVPEEQPVPAGSTNIVLHPEHVVEPVARSA
jgi:hypothetical protein